MAKHRIAILNRKGGVGKTTCTIGLASAFAKDGLSTLVIDMDPQSNACFGLGADPSAPGTASLLCGEEPQYQSRSETLQVLAGGPALEDHRVQALDQEELFFALQNDKHDVVLFDCPPGSDHLERLAVIASTVALIPVDAHPFAIIGAQRVADELHQRKERSQRGPERWAIIRSQIDNRRAADRELPEALSETFPGVKQLELIQDTAIKNATSSGELVFEACPSSRGAACLLKMKEWVLNG